MRLEQPAFDRKTAERQFLTRSEALVKDNRVKPDLPFAALFQQFQELVFVDRLHS